MAMAWMIMVTTRADALETRSLRDFRAATWMESALSCSSLCSLSGSGVMLGLLVMAFAVEIFTSHWSQRM